MDIDDFKKAEVIVSEIDSVKELIKDFSLGSVSATDNFRENNNDFYNANFIKVFETKGYHSTGGGSCEPCRMTIARHKDMSGVKYELSKQETINLQEFLKSMLDTRIECLTSILKGI